MSKINNIAAILNKSVVYFKPFTSNVFLRNNEAYKLYYTLKEVFSQDSKVEVGT